MLADWIETYRTWLVLLGGIVEGEAVFIAAGYAISQGYLHPAPTLLVAILGCTLGDHVFYLVGRSYGASALERFPLLRRPRAHAIAVGVV